VLRDERAQQNAARQRQAASSGRLVEPYGWRTTVLAIFFGGLAIIIAYLLLVKLRGVLYLFAAAYIFAYFLEPLVQRLQKVGWTRAKATWAVFVGVVLLLALTIWALVPALVNQVQDTAANVGLYSEQIIEVYSKFRDSAETRLSSYFPSLEVHRWQLLDERIPEAQQWVATHVPAMLLWVSKQLVASLGVIGLGILLLVISFHFMMLAESVRGTVRKLIPPRHSEEVEEVSSEIGNMLGQYLRGVIVLFFANGIGATVIIYVLGFFFGNKYALVVGVLTGITNMVPYVGPVVSAGSAFVLTYVTATSSPVLASLLAVGLMLIMSQYFAIIVQPKIIGRRINLDPLIVLFAMFAGFELFGFLGIIIGVPIAGCIKIVLAKWVPVIGLGPGVRAPSEPLLLDVGRALRTAQMSVQRWRNVVARPSEAQDGGEKSISQQHLPENDVETKSSPGQSGAKQAADEIRDQQQIEQAREDTDQGDTNEDE